MQPSHTRSAASSPVTQLHRPVFSLADAVVLVVLVVLVVVVVVVVAVVAVVVVAKMVAQRKTCCSQVA